MALTPEDVVNKRFQPTKFREGYDQDEVDDFLDEIVVELRRLNQENEELRQRLSGQGQDVPQPVAAAPKTEVLDTEAARTDESADDEVVVEEPAAETAVTPIAAAPVPAPVVAAPTVDAGSTNNLLQVARRLHDDHVREGQEKRDQLVAEGHAQAARIVSDAETKQRQQIGALQQEQSLLEHRIDELRVFEREYRQKLRGYIEGQLRELDGSNVLNTGGAPVGEQQNSNPAPASGGFQAFGGH